MKKRKGGYNERDRDETDSSTVLGAVETHWHPEGRKDHVYSG